MSNSAVEKISVNKWIDDNKDQFLPPVCNKLMHNDQLTIMFVGGPNVRKDYHLEEGEELFYQLKGDMCLKVLEQNQHRDVIIKEGEIFLLPARIPHSPNRFENTVGFVMERRREENELDCLRYFQNQSTNRLFERWFHTTDLGIQLKPVIQEFFASEEYRTNQPKPDSFPQEPPVKNDDKLQLISPFSLNNWLEQHQHDLSREHPISLFPDQYQTRVWIFPKGEHTIDCSTGDVWLWQHKGHSTARIVTADRKESVVKLEPSDSVYLNVDWT
ncbi:unnamed protein product, partial [Adineta ricciae]